MTNKNESNLDIPIDFKEYKTLLNYKGRISGHNYNISKLDNLENEINYTIINDLKSAKGILIEFRINQKENIFTLNKILIFIQESIDTDAVMIFGTKVDSTLILGETSCKILLTGLD